MLLEVLKDRIQVVFKTEEREVQQLLYLYSIKPANILRANLLNWTKLRYYYFNL